MAQNPDLLTNLYNAFDPFRPLPAGDPNYVDCREVRGDGDILEDLGTRLQRSNVKTCQLYSGHRGAGKSTELLRLKDALEKEKFFVVYFADRCLLEYRYLDDEGEIQRWCDVHPLIRGIQEFKEAVANLGN